MKYTAMKMKRLLFIAVLLLVAGCGKARERRTEDSPKTAPSTRAAAGETPPRAGASPDTGGAPEAKTAADPRQVLLEQELAAYEDTVIAHDAGELTAGEKSMLKHLMEAGALLDELYMLQLHPDNLTWLARVRAEGTDVEKRLYARNRMPWCEDNNSSACTVLPAAGPRRIGAVFWPDGFTGDQYEGLSREINAKELLSPFTAVRAKEPRGYEAVPFAGLDLFAQRMRQVRRALEAAAEFAPSPTLKTFLQSRAEAFSSLNPFPYDDSDYDWIALKGDWEVTVGPYETYKSPFQTKALFEMVIAREDKALSDSLTALKRGMQEMENALSLLVGEGVYKARKMDKRIAVRAVDVWAAFGDARHSRGAVLAYHLPNRGRSVDEGVYKKVILVNHAQAMEEVTRARAGLILDSAQQSMLTFRAGITNTAYHELAHGFGAYHEMRVTDKEGRLTTVKEALREYDSVMEEIKADTLGLWLSKMEKDAGAIDEAELRRRYVSSTVHLLGLLQYPADDTYTRMAAAELGRLIEAGAVVWDEESGRASVVFEKMGDALTALVKETALIQLTGDYSAARDFVGRYVASDSELKGAPATVRAAVIDAFQKGNLKSPSLRYTVNGLP